MLPDGAVFPGELDDLMLSAYAVLSQAQLDAELDAAVEGAGEGEAAQPSGESSTEQE